MQSKAQIDKRLARIEGQVRGLRRMVEDDAYCVDVLTQIAAVRAALDQAAAQVAMEHVRHCVARDECAHAEAQAKTQDELMDELGVVLKRLMS